MPRGNPNPHTLSSKKSGAPLVIAPVLMMVMAAVMVSREGHPPLGPGDSTWQPSISRAICSGFGEVGTEHRNKGAER